MLGLIVPFLIGWGLVIWAHSFATLLIGRFIIGLSGGAFCISAPQYSSEIVEVNIRGTVGSFFELMISSGILFTYIIGAFVSVRILTLMCAALPIIFGAVFAFMPESPLYLIKINRTDEARRSLRWLRGETFDYSEEIDCWKEDKEISQTKSSIFSYLKQKAVRKSVVIGFGLGIFQQLAAINVVVFYATQIFEV